MTTVYIGSTLMWRGSLKDIFLMAKDSGLQGIEMWAQQFIYGGFDEDEFRELMESTGIKACMHSQSWDLNPASMNEGIRSQSVKEIIKSVELAKRLGINEVTVHPGHRTVNCEAAPYEDYLRRSFSEILGAAENAGVRVSLEIMEKIPKEFVTDMQAMRRVCGPMFDKFLYTLDIAHCDSDEEALRTLDADRGHISKIHISNRRGNKFHTPLSEGDHNMRDLIPKLAGYGLPMVIEGFDESKDFSTVKDNIGFIRNILKNGGEEK